MRYLHELASQNTENFSSHVEEFARQLNAENSSNKSLQFSASMDPDDDRIDEEEEEEEMDEEVVDDDEIVNSSNSSSAIGSSGRKT